MIWCFASGDHPEARLCQQAGHLPHTIEMWMEAYLPKQGEFREIDYVEKKDRDCAGFQRAQYDIDPSYVACVVKKLDAPIPVK